MKKRIVKIAIITLSVIVVCLVAWRLWPCNFSKVMPVSEDAVINFSAHAMVGRFENGESYNDTYQFNILETQKDSLREIFEILEASSYKQDFRNLLPWGIDYVDADKNYDGKSVYLLFVYGNEKDECISIQFLSSSIIAVSTGRESGFQIYHPTNHETIDKLVEYLQTHGTKQ